MKVAIGSDHAAVEQRLALAAHLRAGGHEVADHGCEAGQSVDYPDYAALVGRAVAAGDAERGVLLCGTGIGISMAANKIDGIRAALVTDDFTCEMARRHTDANVLCMGGRLLAVATLCRLADRFLATPFDGGRHAARVAKIMSLEHGALEDESSSVKS
jgi:ribose 5-phosphate isomerase B